MGLLEETLDAIALPGEAAGAEAGRRLDSLTKPRGSLGHLEEIVRRYLAVDQTTAGTGWAWGCTQASASRSLRSAFDFRAADSLRMCLM